MGGCAHIKAPEVGLELAREDLECGRLADTVRADEAEDLARARRGQSMELERVGRVAVRHLRLEVGRQVDDVDRLKRAPVRVGQASAWQLMRCWGREKRERHEDALLGADTAADAELLRDERNLGRRRDLDAELACAR